MADPADHDFGALLRNFRPTWDGPDARGGVAVLMRYTLRQLTARQFQRAAALVCAAEVLRQQARG
jgi:hypothetical protein